MTVWSCTWAFCLCSGWLSPPGRIQRQNSSSVDSLTPWTKIAIFSLHHAPVDPPRSALAGGAITSRWPKLCRTCLYQGWTPILLKQNFQLDPMQIRSPSFYQNRRLDHRPCACHTNTGPGSVSLIAYQASHRYQSVWLSVRTGVLRQPEQVQTFLCSLPYWRIWCRSMSRGAYRVHGEIKSWLDGLLAHTLKNSLFALPVARIRYRSVSSPLQGFPAPEAFKEYPEMSRIILLRLANYFRKKKDWYARMWFIRIWWSSWYFGYVNRGWLWYPGFWQSFSPIRLARRVFRQWYKKHPELLSLLGSVRIMRGQVEEALLVWIKPSPIAGA